MNIVIKIIIAIFLVVIVFNLGKAMRSMLTPPTSAKTMSTYIGRRLLFSVLLVLLLLVSLFMGWISPNPSPY